MLQQRWPGGKEPRSKARALRRRRDREARALRPWALARLAMAKRPWVLAMAKVERRRGRGRHPYAEIKWRRLNRLRRG